MDIIANLAHFCLHGAGVRDAQDAILAGIAGVVGSLGDFDKGLGGNTACPGAVSSEA